MHRIHREIRRDIGELWHRFLHRVKLLRLMKRECPQQHAVDDAEHGCIRANSHRQNQNHDGRITRIAPQRAQCVTKVHTGYTNAACPKFAKNVFVQTANKSVPNLKGAMPSATFVAAIVLALVVGVLLTALWFRSRPSPPVMATLQRLEAQIKDVESQRQHMLGGLDQHLTSLSRETVALSQALSAPNSRGRWGELTLRRVAELSGMASQCDFYEQIFIRWPAP